MGVQIILRVALGFPWKRSNMVLGQPVLVEPRKALPVQSATNQIFHFKLLPIEHSASYKYNSFLSGILHLCFPLVLVPFLHPSKLLKMVFRGLTKDLHGSSGPWVLLGANDSSRICL